MELLRTPPRTLLRRAGGWLGMVALAAAAPAAVVLAARPAARATAARASEGPTRIAFDAALATVVLGDRAERVEALGAALGEVVAAEPVAAHPQAWRRVAGDPPIGAWAIEVRWRGLSDRSSWRFWFDGLGILRCVERSAG